MEQGLIPEADPRLLYRALLGLHNSVWQWFHLRGTLSLAEVGNFYVRRCLAVLGLDPALADAADEATPKLEERAAQAACGPPSRPSREAAAGSNQRPATRGCRWRLRLPDDVPYLTSIQCSDLDR